MSLLMMMTQTTLLSLILFMLTWMINKNRSTKMQENYGFECGFNQTSSSLIPFSSQFFLIAILFLVFDLEITLFLPFMISEVKNSFMMMVNLTIMSVMTMGLIMEWIKGMIEWSK